MYTHARAQIRKPEKQAQNIVETRDDDHNSPLPPRLARAGLRGPQVPRRILKDILDHRRHIPFRRLFPLPDPPR